MSSTLHHSSRTPALRASGTYTGPRVRGRSFHKAELVHVPMHEPHEYESVALFERHPQAAPVLVSPSQRYAMLTALVRALRSGVPGLQFIGVRLIGSDFDVQLSTELLAADVLVTHAPLQLLPSMLRAGRRNLVIVEQDLRADGLEQGGNGVAVWLVAPTDEADDAFHDFVARNTFLQGLHRLRLESVAV